MCIRDSYGVLMYVSFIFMAFFFGYSIAVTPVVGYHYGAKNHAELKSLLKKSLTVTLITSLAMTASSILLANPIAHLFVGYDAELCDMTVNALRIYALSFLVCGFNIFGSAFFTGLNNGTASALISFLRTLVFQVAAILLLPRWLDINGIWLAITVAEALTSPQVAVMVAVPGATPVTLPKLLTVATAGFEELRLTLA